MRKGRVRGWKMKRGEAAASASGTSLSRALFDIPILGIDRV